MNYSQTPSQNHIYDYIVVGSGISGLQSLQILSKQTKNVIALESQGFQGSRILSQSLVSLPGANNLPWIKANYDKLKNVYIEKGATWIEQQHKYLLQICKDFGLELREQNSQGQNLYLFKGKALTTKQLKNDKRFGSHLYFFLNKIQHLSKLYDKYVLTPNSNKSRQVRMLNQYDSKLVSEFLQQNCMTKQTQQLLQNFFQHTECVSCQQNSMHEVLTKNARSNDVGIFKQFLGEYGADGHQPSYLVNAGTSAITSKFLQKIQQQIGLPQNKFILYNRKVIVIDNKRQICSITAINTKTGKPVIYRCRKVICSVPLAVSRSITFTKISPAKKYIIDNQLRTTCMKSFLIVKKPFWRKFASGDCLFSSQHLVNMSHDISPTDLSCGIMVFFHSGKKYQQWQSRFKNQSNQYQAKRKYIMDLTCQLYSVTEEQKRLYMEDALYYISTFMDIPDIRSGFQSCTSPGTFTTLAKSGEGIDALYRDQKNVYFIGSQYSMEFASYIEGAIRVARKKCYQLIGQQDDLFSKNKNKNGVNAAKL